MEKKIKVKRKKLNIARTLVLILIIYIVVCFGIKIYNTPVRHYEIKGNSVLKDVEIIRLANLENYPSYVGVNSKKLKKILEKNSLIKKAKVKHGFNYKIIIEVEENKPVLVIKSTNEVILADGTKINNDNNYLGLPVLLNQTPDDILKNLTNNLSLVDEGILHSISEIEYKPSYNKDGKIIDENRFLLSMNDKNLVYISAKKAKRLNKYLDIIATSKITGNGTLYLDGDEYGNLFELFEVPVT